MGAPVAAQLVGPAADQMANVQQAVAGLKAARVLPVLVPSVPGVILTLTPSLSGPVTWAKSGGDANPSVSAGGDISVTTAIPVGEQQTITVSERDAAGVTASTQVIMTAYAAVMTRVMGTVTRTKDGSAGQTYTAPPGMIRPQWFRESLDVSKTLTLIPGATGATYTSTTADVGYRLTVRGFVAGDLTLAVPDVAVYAAPRLLEGFESLSGFTMAGSPVVALDSSWKVQGTTSLSITGTGVSSSAKKANIGTWDPSSFDVLAVIWRVDGDPDMQQYAGSRVRIDLTSGAFGPSSLIVDGSATTDSGTFKLGGYVDAIHVSEHPILSTQTGPVQLGIQCGGPNPTSPMNGTVQVDSLMANAGGMPTLTYGFDDALPEQYTNGAPLLEKYGFRGTWYIPVALIDTPGHMTTAQVLDLYGRKHDMQLDGRSNDQAIIDLASEAAFVADLRAQIKWFTDRGLPAPKHICYPNGTFRGYNSASEPNQGGTRIQLSGVSCTVGTRTLTVSSTAGIVPGMKVIRVGFPTTGTFARVVSASGTTVLVDTDASVGGSYNAWFVNDSALFHTNRIQTLLKQEGILSGRATYIADGYSSVRLTRFGEFGQAMVYGAQGVSNMTAAQMIATSPKARLRKGTLEYYLHNVPTGGAANGSTPNPGIHCWAENLDLKLADDKTYVDLGQMEVLPQAVRFARDAASSVPI